jgi:hypothetical protein
MNIKYIEIPFENKVVSIPMVETAQKTFILGKLEHYDLLSKNLVKWASQNVTTSDTDYQTHCEAKVPNFNRLLADQLAVLKKGQIPG